MRIYEVVCNQNIANEQILTEIDWKKLRNALIGGVMSLAVLGAPGQAIEKALDANKITADQAIELIKKKLASGEIDSYALQDLKKLELPKFPPRATRAEIDAEAERLKKIVKPGSVKPTIAQKEPWDDYGPGPRYKIDNLPFTVDKQGTIMSGPLSGAGLGSTSHPLAQHFDDTKDQWSKYNVKIGNVYNPNSAYMQWRLANDKVDTKSTPTVKQDDPKKTEPVVKKDEPKKAEPTVKKDEPKKAEPKGKLDPAQQKFLKYGEMGPYKVVRSIKQTAFDADSLKFKDWNMVVASDTPDSPYLIITGKVNGKNKIGGYTGFKDVVATLDPDTGEVQKLYYEYDKLYPQVMALIKSMKYKYNTPLIGPS